MTISSAFSTIGDSIVLPQRCSVAATVTPGIPSFGIASVDGPYPDSDVREVRDRVRAAIMSTGLPWPAARVTVVIDPAPRRVWCNLDLAIAVAVLAAADPARFGRFYGLGAIGTLNLDGRLVGDDLVVDLTLAEWCDTAVVVIPGSGGPIMPRQDRLVVPCATLADVVEFVQVDPSLANDPPIDESVPA